MSNEARPGPPPIPPVALVRDLEARYPDAWRRLETFRDPSFRRWPDATYLPIAAGIALVTDGHPNPSPLLAARPKLLADAAALVGAAAWRVTKGVYRFAPDLLEVIASTRFERGLPSGLFARLPEWCVYIETPGWDVFGQIAGFMAWIEFDTNTRGQELRFLTLTEAGASQPLVLPLEETLEAGLDRFAATVGTNRARWTGADVPLDLEDFARLARGHLERMAALVLYLCSEGPDLESLEGRTPGKPVAKVVKGRERLFAPNLEITYRVGFNLARALELGDGTGDGGHRESVRPHVRRAHAHLYWTGEGRKTPSLRWVMPTLVGVKPDEELGAVTVREVEGHQRDKP